MIGKFHTSPSVCSSSMLGLMREPCSSQEIQAVQDELQQLRSRVVELENTVTFFKDIKDSLRLDSGAQVNSSPAAATAATVATVDSANTGHSPASSKREGVPKAPQFVGPTRSAFGIIIGERSLTRMGIPTYESMPPGGAHSPTNEALSPEDYWQSITAAEVARLLTVFQEEVESIYPILDIGEQAARADQILHVIRHGASLHNARDSDLSPKDVDIVKVAMATAIVLETHGKTELSTMIVQTVENNVQVIARPEVDLKEIQLISMLVWKLLFTQIPLSFPHVMSEGSNTTGTEHLLLPLRRRTTCLANDRHCSAGGAGDGPASEEEPV